MINNQKPPEWLKIDILGIKVDLNNPKTYSNCRYRNWTCSRIRDEIYRQIGYVTLYNGYFINTDICPEQLAKINQMLFWFGKEHSKYYQDTPEGRIWLRKWLFIFNNLIENLC